MTLKWLGLMWFAAAIVWMVTGCATNDTGGSGSSGGAGRGTPSNTGINPTEGPAAGMWLPNAVPAERIKQLYGFAPTAQWLEHLRLSSVHIGASGSFVSADGLVLTNHHVAVGGLHNISREGKDYVANGFLAKTRSEEARLPGMELSVLESIEDVTPRVNAAIDAAMTGEEAVKARRAVIAKIERQALEQTGLHGNVVTLYGGALYHLYLSKKYTDIRAVFAPEVAIAFFGGDPDNFEYPRYDLDITILRAYENDQPAHVKNYLSFSRGGVKEGEPVFISGHPGRTERLLPVAALEGMRDVTTPPRVEGMERMERALLDYSKRGPEAARQAEGDLFGIQNGLKATRPRLASLQGGLIERKRMEENVIRAKLREREDLRKFDAAWDRAAAAEKKQAELFLRQSFLEEGRAFRSVLFGRARELVRLSAEDAKPDTERLPEYTQSKRESLEHWLFADEPIYPELEIVKLATTLRFCREKLGEDAPETKTILAGKSPEARAEELVRGTKLGDAAERRRIRQGGAAAIASSDDPMIRLAVLIDAESRKVRQEYEATVQEPQTQALTDINRARFALMGNEAYPDATGTLRFAFGVVEGYEQDGSRIPPWTTIGGAFDHSRKHGEKEPYALPARWQSAKSKLAGRTPFNFICTADITGGNSGSPVVNRAGELVGIIFDSNRQGVVNDFEYTDVQARAVAVDARAILEALAKIYDARNLIAELTGTGKNGE
jgi:hypothetical protein